MIILYDNLLDNGFTASSQQNTYPGTHINDKTLQTLWKSTGNTAAIIISGTSLVVSAVSLLNHNLTSSATVTIQGNAVNDWAAPAYSKTLTVGDSMFETFTAATYDYFRLLIEDATISYISIGYCFIGPQLTTRGVAPGTSITYRTEDTKQISRAGRVFGTTKYTYREISTTIPNMTNTERNDIITAWESRRSVSPVILAVWGDFHEPPCFCTFAEPEFSTIGAKKWQGNLTFREVL